MHQQASSRTVEPGVHGKGTRASQSFYHEETNTNLYQKVQIFHSL